jgi:hypothetical protein
MKKGISLHLGLNSIDPAHYNGNDGKLKNPENDARAMKQLAERLGFEATTLLTKEATSTRVLSELYRVAQQLVSGDTLLVSFAGHGAQVPDLHMEEDDGYDETWVLYDRMMLDDELYNVWSKFKAGVRIILVSDSCHSGTVSRVAEFDTIATSVYKDNGLFRSLAPQDALAAFENDKELYECVKYAIPRNIQRDITASVLLLSGCQDNQLSSDGVRNGLFTSKLLATWNGGNYSGTYRAFHAQIKSQMPSIQTPNYYWVGAVNDLFEQEKPFSIESAREAWIEELDTTERNGKKISWEIEVPEQLLRGLNDAELESCIRSYGCQLMLESFKKFKELPSQLISTRGGEISGGCSAGDKGWSCEVKGSIRF